MPPSFSVRRLIGLFFRSLFWSLNVALVLYTLLLYWLLYSLPVQHWSASMLMITLPVAWLFNGICLIIWLFANPWRSILSLLALLTGFWLWPRTFAIHTQQPAPTSRPVLRVLSYNVANFNANDFFSDPPKRAKAQQLTDWVVRQEAPVKCFQEFFSSPRHPTITMTERLRKAGYGYSVTLRQDANAFIGVAIFSKYAIINQGIELFGQHVHNGIVWADIRLDSDTVRIINVHLESMGIRVRRVLNQEEMAGVRSETRGILAQLREGFTARSQQIRRVEKHIADSPYPVVVTGDFNDTPYSVAYGRIRAKLNSTFEEAGSGFGFTLNRAPKLLRIDNQFYDSKRLTPLSFKTFNDVPYSDHFPIYGEYVVNE